MRVVNRVQSLATRDHFAVRLRRVRRAICARESFQIEQGQDVGLVAGVGGDILRRGKKIEVGLTSPMGAPKALPYGSNDRCARIRWGGCWGVSA